MVLPDVPIFAIRQLNELIFDLSLPILGERDVVL